MPNGLGVQVPPPALINMIKVLFFCAANSCRSPAALGIFSALIEGAGLNDHFWLESAGTYAAVGRPAHPETARVAARRDIDLQHHRSRPLEASDFAEFDYLIGMDSDNIAAAEALSPAPQRHKIRLLLIDPPRDVPDPFRLENGFEAVHTLIEHGARALLEELRRKHELP